MSTVDIARGYLRRGLCPIPAQFKSKKPNTPDRQHMRLREDDLEGAFSGKINIGVVLGPPSNGLTDVDLDCREVIAIAPFMLPRTGAISDDILPPRRTGYTTRRSPPGRRRRRSVQDPISQPTTRCCLKCASVEKKARRRRFTRLTRKSVGRSWRTTEISDNDLLKRARLLASACLFARYWPRCRGGAAVMHAQFAMALPVWPTPVVRPMRTRSQTTCRKP